MNLGKMMTSATLRLGVFGLATAFLLGLTYEITRPQIIEQERRAELRVYEALVPPSMYDNDLLNSQIQLSAEMTSLLNTEGVARVAKQDGEPVAIVFRSDALDGYSGRISMVMAVTTSGELLGLRVISHNETPGLGDKIDIRKSDWINSFDDKTYSAEMANDWYVKKDGGEFDQFTGATITPRAVVGQARKTLEYIDSHPNWLEEAN